MKIRFLLIFFVKKNFLYSLTDLFRMKKIGVITIGQSPRPDVVGEILRVLGKEYEVVEKGALDDYTAEEVKDIQLKPGEHLLVTKLRNGQEIKISHELVVSRIQSCVDFLEKTKVDIILLLCTGKFPEFNSKHLIIQPSEIVRGTVVASIRRGKLAVILPAREQIPKMTSNAYGAEVKIYYDSASPYGSIEELKEMAKRVSKENVDLVFLNCMGFTHEMKLIVKDITNKPVIQSSSLVGRVIQEIVE